MPYRILCWLWLLSILIAGCQPASDPAPEGAESPPAAAPEGPPQGPGKTASADGVEIAYSVQGRGEPALVFVHGWSCDQGFWSEQVDFFAASRAVVTLDLGGHGASGTGRAEWRLADFGRDVQAVVETLGFERVILVGHSLGGAAVLTAAQLMPDRAVGVVGVDTFHDAERRRDPARRAQVIQAFEGDFAASCEGFVRSTYPDAAAAPLVARIVADMCDAPAEIAVGLMRAASDYDLGREMSLVRAPIRSINSDFAPTAVETNRKYDPDFEVTLLEGAGHFLMMERPQEFNRLLAETVTAFENSLIHAE